MAYRCVRLRACRVSVGSRNSVVSLDINCCGDVWHIFRSSTRLFRLLCHLWHLWQSLCTAIEPNMKNMMSILAIRIAIGKSRNIPFHNLDIHFLSGMRPVSVRLPSHRVNMGRVFSVALISTISPSHFCRHKYLRIRLNSIVYRPT